MSHWKLTLSYDGTRFHGWQVQPGLFTIQGTLAHALASLTGEDVLPQGSGRTDTGVHALAQVASLTLAADIPAPSLFRALNRILPPSVRVLSAEIVPATFHARHSARRKTYEYRIFEQRPWMRSPRAEGPPSSQPGAQPQVEAMQRERALKARFDYDDIPLPQRFCSPFLAPYVWEYRWPLNLDLMQQAAATLVGTHDFTSFAATDPDLTQRTHTPEGCHPKRSEGPTSRPATTPEGCHPERSEGPASGSATTPEGCHPERSEGPASRLTIKSPNPIKTIYASTCLRENGLLIYRVTGSGFLHHMVRNLVGTLTDIGRGALPPDAIPAILAARTRSAAGPTAPPQGLYLVSVDYDPHPEA